MNTRDIGLNHGCGKGDADRTDNVEAFRANYDEIDWHRTPEPPVCATCGMQLRTDYLGSYCPQGHYNQIAL
jgi:hypothetical protein